MMNAEFITKSNIVAVTLGKLARDSTNENALRSLGGHGIGIIAIPRLSLQDDMSPMRRRVLAMLRFSSNPQSWTKDSAMVMDMLMRGDSDGWTMTDRWEGRETDTWEEKARSGGGSEKQQRLYS